MRVNKRQWSGCKIPLGVLRLLILLTACTVGLSVPMVWAQEQTPSESVGDESEVQVQAQEPNQQLEAEEGLESIEPELSPSSVVSSGM
ncbi:MAG TPA: hypothetical protein PKH07_01255, partial [bacterium]|nr:hypothetical protein [bacterium]